MSPARGRPPFLWRAETGEAFVRAVIGVRYDRHPIKTVDAINIVLKRPQFAHLKKRYTNIRYLEKKFQEASDFWNPYARLGKKWRTIYRNKDK